MEIQDEVRNKSKKKKLPRNFRISFSAKLPDDVNGAFTDCICAVQYSTDPFWDIRESILEVMENVGVQDWAQMEELIYCYIALNSSELHSFIEDAFRSVYFPCSTSN